MRLRLNRDAVGWNRGWLATRTARHEAALAAAGVVTNPVGEREDTTRSARQAKPDLT